MGYGLLDPDRNRVLEIMKDHFLSYSFKVRLVLLSLAAGILLSGCTTIYNPATKRRETYFISEQTELSLGKSLAQDIMRDQPVVREEKMLAYVREVGSKVSRISDRNNIVYTFNIIDSDEFNAFALPGGYVFVNRGLVAATSRDELAFVLGHEIGHIAARHSLKRMQAALGLKLVTDLAFKNSKYPDLRRAVDLVYKAVSSGYSRQDEFLADTLGATYAQRAGFAPRASLSLMEKLKSKSEQKSFVFFSSHPQPEARISNLRSVISSLPRNGTRLNP